jgi:uncharacterized protein (DUF1697 family)
MAKFVALLRAVNVGGTGKLAMTELKSICAHAGFDNVQTYIASGNVVLESNGTAARVRSELESRLRDHTGRAIEVFVRTAAEMSSVLRGNPFPKADPSKTYVFFLNNKPPRDAATQVLRQVDEAIRAGSRELYVYYPLGMGQSKMAIPAASGGTARNMNTVGKLVAMMSL